MNIQLIIAMHKPYEVPQDALYLPLHVGSQGKESFACSRPVTRDDTGVHISGKNAFYCELTGLYWAWKNLEADAIGLVHYRRYFTCKSRRYRNQHPKMDCVKQASTKASLSPLKNLSIRAKMPMRCSVGMYCA